VGLNAINPRASIAFSNGNVAAELMFAQGLAGHWQVLNAPVVGFKSFSATLNKRNPLARRYFSGNYA